MSKGYEPGWGLEVLPYFKKYKKMGNAGITIERHVEQAKKTGVCNLQGMGLTKFPEELKGLASNLRTLDISDNKLRSVPSFVGEFKNLKTLSISANRLIELPEELSKLSRLETLQVDGNSLTSLPGSVSTLKNLKSVSLAQNQFASLPACLCEIDKLEFLDISSNKVETMPDNIGNISVVELNLNSNRLAALPGGLSQAKRLKVLRVSENVLTLEAGIPSEILSSSVVSLLVTEGNLFTSKDLSAHPGYDEYMARYSASRKKVS